MNNEKQKPALSGVERIVPELRFPEFENSKGWKKKPFSKLFKIGSGRDYKHLGKGEIPVYGTGGYMLSINDFLYDGKSACIGRKGTINKPILLSGKFWTVDTLFYTHSFKDCTPEFIYLLFQNINWLNYNEAGGVPSLSKVIINKIEVYIPEPTEQKKIVDFITSLDNLITAEKEKLLHLKDHKKGLLQQLFTANGETKPQYRFPEFKNDGDWEIKEVGEIFEVTRGYVLSMSLVFEKQTEENNYPVYSSQTKNNGLAGYYKDFLYENAITWTTDGANAGDVNYRDGKFYCTNVCGVLINNNGMANKCIAALINSVSKSHVSYIGNPKLMNGVMSKIEIPIPSLNEQIKISEVITSADDLIEAQVLKIKNLKKHKKGLMQQLFPNVNEL